MDKARITPLTILAVMSIFFLCMLAASMLVMYLLGPSDIRDGQDYYRTISAHLAGSVISFALPAVIVSVWKFNRPFYTLTDNRHVPLLAWVLAVACITVCQPLVEWSAFVNQQICMKMDSWESMLNFYRMNNELYCSLMKHNSPLECSTMVISMAILPAICEEMFFRGTMQRILVASSRSVWAAIITASAVFSLLHGDMLNFFPRFMLGFILGVVYHFSGNIWTCILLHVINNCAAVISIIMIEGDPLETLNKLQENPGPVAPIIALALTILGIQGFIYRTRKSEQ